MKIPKKALLVEGPGDGRVVSLLGPWHSIPFSNWEFTWEARYLWELVPGGGAIGIFNGYFRDNCRCDRLGQILTRLP